MVTFKWPTPLLGRARANTHHGQEFAPLVGRIHFCRPPPIISSFCLTPSGGPYISCPSPRGGVSWTGTPPHTRQEHHRTKDAPLSKRRARKPDSTSPVLACVPSGEWRFNRSRRREHNNVLCS